MDRSQRLGTEKIKPLLWSLSLPAMIGMLSVTIYNVADTIFIGHAVGTLGIAAISVSLPLMMSITTFGQAIGLGGASVISRALGAGNKAKAQLTLHSLLTIIISINFILITLAYLKAGFFLKLFGANDEILPYAVQYVRWSLPGSFFLNILFVSVHQIRAEGNARFPMFSQILGGVLNIIFDPIFIFGLGWGLMGAALASSISQFVGFCLAMWYFTKNPKSVLKLNIRKLWALPDKAITLEVLAIGASSFGRQIAGSIMSIVLNNALLRYGGAASIAAFGIINRITMFVFMPLFGLNQGFMPIAGFNYGAKKILRVLRGMKIAIIWSTSFCIATLILFFVFANSIVSVFTTDKELIAMATKSLRIFILAFPVVGFQIVGSGLFQALGKAKASMFLALARQVLFLIPFVLIFPKFWGENGIWFSFPISDFLAASVTFLMVVNLVKKLKKEDKENRRLNLEKAKTKPKFNLQDETVL
jgi:putative MATE family efflux protein